MARPLRIEYAGAIYHITSRGNERKSIFQEERDHELFLDILHQVKEKYNWLCHAYCLMDNHYHIVVETVEGNLAKGMRQLNGIYTQTYNRRHNRVGHVFQGRYKAILIQKDSHLLEICRYVVLNPVMAGVVEKPGAWIWSSYNATAGKAAVHCILTVKWVLEQFGKSKETASKRYEEFVMSGIGQDSIWQQVKGQMLLGEEGFADNLVKYTNVHKEVDEIPRSQRHLNRPFLEKLFEGSVFYDKVERNRRIVEAVYMHGYSQREVSDFLGLHYSTVSVVVGQRE